jgi:glycosyltransferase involved in cell wall biosynthesis
MRIVYVSAVGVIGGAERALLTLLGGLRELGAPVEAHALLGADGPLQQALQKLDVRVEVLPLPQAAARVGDSGTARSLGTWWNVSRRLLLAAPGLARYLSDLKRRLRGLRPDIVHSNSLKSHVVTALARPPAVPLAWHMHDFLTARPVLATVLRRLRHRAALALAVSASVAEDVQRVLSPVPVELLPNAVDPRQFCAQGPVADLDALAGLPPAPPGLVRVGLVATYARWKGQEVFLQAAARLPADRHVRFYVVGGPLYQPPQSQWSRVELEQLARAAGLEGRVGFVAFQPDPAPVYRALDIVVHASTQPEPFGLTIVEAMACGRCVVASKAGGAAELFRDGIEAIGVEPASPARLAEVLQQLLDDPCRRHRLQQSACQAAQRFDPRPAAQKLLAIYHTLMNMPRPSSRIRVNS